VLFGALGWLGRIAGYQAAYPEYGVITASELEMPASATVSAAPGRGVGISRR
jgi:hypothetical protein